MTSGVRCFCTEEHCTYGVCESPWCLVGIKESGPVIRTCGNEAARMLQICRRRVGEWLEVRCHHHSSNLRDGDRLV